MVCLILFQENLSRSSLVSLRVEFAVFCSRRLGNFAAEIFFSSLCCTAALIVDFRNLLRDGVVSLYRINYAPCLVICVGIRLSSFPTYSWISLHEMLFDFCYL